eukprot:scaffold1832_cov362-Prasinococcus_capsulatus_cf.AAC.12
MAPLSINPPPRPRLTLCAGRKGAIGAVPIRAGGRGVPIENGDAEGVVQVGQPNRYHHRALRRQERASGSAACHRDGTIR